MVENSYSVDSAEGSWGHDDGEPSPVVYLNHAGHAPLAPEVKNAGIYALQRPPWEMPADDDPKRVREMFASLIEAEDASDIAIMPSTAFAISLAARNIQKCLPKNKKGRILIIQDQMCSAIYPWQELCEESNGDIELDIVPHPTTMGGGWTESILKRIDENVLVACLPPLHWSDGALVDLEAVGAACRKYGIILIVDATQGKEIGRMQTDPGKCFCSFSLKIYAIFTSYWHNAVQCKEAPTDTSSMQCAQGMYQVPGTFSVDSWVYSSRCD
jgi:selenocysteine lyase/cysteine desulfurase